MKAVFFALHTFCFLVAINAGITFKEVLDSALGFRNAKGIVDGAVSITRLEKRLEDLVSAPIRRSAPCQENRNPHRLTKRGVKRE